jgi:hypothetical protein
MKAEDSRLLTRPASQQSMAQPEQQISRTPLADVFRRYGDILLVCVALLGLIVGGSLWWRGASAEAALAWALATAPVLAALFFPIIT